MRTLVLALSALAAAAAPAPAQGPKGEQREEDFVKGKPAVGDPVPDLTVYTPDGKEAKTADLRGRYVVLTFGCLT
jgi:cytochrome oxidase Cu insertion factor (SCO1/SenC/PrrC family)